MLRHIIFIALPLLLIVGSCTISGEQEEQLNVQLGNFINAHNEQHLLELIGLTEPHVVRFYKNQGDSTFIVYFKDFHDGNQTYFENPTYRETRSEEKLIQRKYWIEYYTNSVEINHEYCIFAMSDDGGDNWFFLKENDYYNKEIKGFKRLFD